MSLDRFERPSLRDKHQAQEALTNAELQRVADELKKDTKKVKKNKVEGKKLGRK